MFFASFIAQDDMLSTVLPGVGVLGAQALPTSPVMIVPAAALPMAAAAVVLAAVVVV